MAKVAEIVKTALIRKTYQDGVINGIKLLSNSLVDSKEIKNNEFIQKMEIALISLYLEQARKLQEAKQNQFIFSENREAYIKILKDNKWTQEDYIYLFDKAQLRNLSNPVIKYMGQYSKNPKLDEVRKMERARTFTNKD